MWIRNTAKVCTEGQDTPLKVAGGDRGEPHSAPHPSLRQEGQYARSKPASLGCPYHRGEPNGGVNEEFGGLGHPLLDSPKGDRHAGGVQEYEGEPKHLGRQA